MCVSVGGADQERKRDGGEGGKEGCGERVSETDRGRTRRDEKERRKKQEGEGRKRGGHKGLKNHTPNRLSTYKSQYTHLKFIHSSWGQ